MTRKTSPQRHHLGGILFASSLFFLIISACFCQFSPYAKLLTTEEPNVTEVTGIYTFAKQTLINSGLDFLNGEQATINLNKDGTFTLVNFPLWQRTEIGEYVLDRRLSASGNWNIEIVGGVLSGGNDYRSVWGIEFSNIIDSASLTGNAPPYGLIFTYDDPDSGNVMIFKMQK